LAGPTPILVTGAAGFIGFHVSRRLLARGDTVIGVDSINAYYDPKLKEARLEALRGYGDFTFHRADISQHGALGPIFAEIGGATVIHLAAQAGVRYSLTNPHAYVESNVAGFLNVLEACRAAGVRHLVYASSSSVYGANTRKPFSTQANVDHPLSLYAATKKANELMAHTYSHLFSIPTTGLRFFTVYGPWGRPDMALFMFTKAILEGTPLDVYNDGRMKRSFTYVDDIVEGVIRVADRPAQPDPTWSGESPDPSSSVAPYKVYNIGHPEPVDLLRFIEVLEETLGKKALKRLLPLQAGDVPETLADVTDLMQDVGFRPSVPIEVGIPRFVEWYEEYYLNDKVAQPPKP
jgi:UDP-glucuronate 4-epimerase